MTEPTHAPSLTRLAAASLAGTAIEFDDFLVYGTAAALVLGPLFFPSFSPVAGTLAAFATFGAGFVARPLGSVHFGHLGDLPQALGFARAGDTPLAAARCCSRRCC